MIKDLGESEDEHEDEPGNSLATAIMDLEITIDLANELAWAYMFNYVEAFLLL